MTSVHAAGHADGRERARRRLLEERCGAGLRRQTADPRLPASGRLTAGSSEVPGLLPLHWGPVLDRVLCGRIDLFRRQKHHRTYARTPRLADGKGERGGTLVVRKVGDGEGVMVAEGEVELLQPSANTLGRSGHSFASAASALPSQTLDALHRVRRFKQEPGHAAPFLRSSRNRLTL